MWLYISLAVTSILCFIYWYFTRTFNYWKKRNVAYDEPVPFFGNIKEFFMKRKYLGAVLDDIYVKFPNEKLVGIYTMTTPAVLLRDPDMIKQLMIKDFDLFADRGVEFSKEGLGANLFHADGDTWRVLRRQFTPIFTSGKLRNMFHLINERGDKLQDYIKEELKMQPSEQNVLLIARKYTMSTIIACAFGLDIDYNDPFISVLNSLDDIIFTNKYRAQEADYMYPGILKKLNLSVFPAGVKTFFQDLVKTVFEQRKGVPSNRNDFMDLILEMKQKKFIHSTKNIDNSELELELTDDVIAAQAFVFYVAGFETSSTTMGFLLYEVSKHPEIQEKLINEIDTYLQKNNGKVSYDTLNELPYMSKVINETLRKYPLVDPLQRRALVDYKVPGTDLTIKKGQTVFVSLKGLHYDPKYFPNPDVFDPERFASENSKDRHSCCYLPFGTGPRNCIGMRFGTVQSSVFLVKFFSRYRVERSKNTPEKMCSAPNRVLLGPKDGTVPLKVVHRFN